MKTQRTQEERSNATKAKILEVALECFLKSGLLATSTVDIAKAAGISRGALQHHYPTRNILLSAVLRHLLDKLIVDVRAMAKGITNGEVDADKFLDELWVQISGSLFRITMEYLNAARTDPEIAAVLTPIAKEFNDTLDEIWGTLMLQETCSAYEKRLALNATFCMMRGMASQSVWRDEPDLFKDILEFWKHSLWKVGAISMSKDRQETSYIENAD